MSKIGPNTLVARGAPTDVEAAFNTTLVTETVHVPAQAGVAPLNGSVVGGAPVSPAPADSATTTVLKAAQPLQPLVGLNLPPGTTATGPPIVGLPTFRAGAVVRPLPPVKGTKVSKRGSEKSMHLVMMVVYVEDIVWK